MASVHGTVNQVELLGWLGGDVELRQAPQGTPVASFSIATKRLGARSEEGVAAIETDWTSIEVWGRTAERCATYLRTGSRVRLSGMLITRTWEDRESGERRFRTFVRADDVLFLDRRPDREGEAEAAGEAAADAGVEELPF